MKPTSGIYHRWMKILRWTLALCIFSGLIGVGLLYADQKRIRYDNRVRLIEIQLEQMKETMVAAGEMIPWSEGWNVDVPSDELTRDQLIFMLRADDHDELLLKSKQWDFAPHETGMAIIIFTLFVFVPAIALMFLSALIHYIWFGPQT